MLANPLGESFQRGQHATTHSGEFVLYARGYLRINMPKNQAVALKIAQCPGQNSLGYTLEIGFQLGKPQPVLDRLKQER